MSDEVERLGPFVVSGAVAWTFPAGFVLLIGLVICWVGLAAFGYFGRVFPCEEEGRLASCFLVGGLASGACLAISAFESVAARIVAGLVGACVLGALAYWGAALVFAPHC